MRDRARVGARHTLAASSCRSGSQALLSLLSATGWAQGDPRGSEAHHRTARKEDAGPEGRGQDIRTKRKPEAVAQKCKQARAKGGSCLEVPGH